VRIESRLRAAFAFARLQFHKGRHPTPLSPQLYRVTVQQPLSAPDGLFVVVAMNFNTIGNVPVIADA
jgi:hypothetical protein